MSEVVAAGVLALVALAVLLLMRRGWVRRREADTTAVPVPPEVPDDDALGDPLTDEVEAVYASTTLADQALVRVHAHGLGERSTAFVRVHEHGTVVRRPGARDLFLPAAATTAVGTSAGQAGKVVGGDGLVVVRWRLGGTEVRTGLRPRRRADRAALLDALRGLVPTTPTSSDPTSPDQEHA